MSTSRITNRAQDARRQRLWIGCLVVLGCLYLTRTALAGPPDPDSAGPDTCAQCHPDQAATWRDSPHARAMEALAGSLQATEGEQQPLVDTECFSCHTTHFDPTDDSFAQPGVSCEVCHGSYVPGHPETGVMQLPADASCCQDCHTTTYQQWHETGHAGAGVQCASCHVPHSQENRVPGEELCSSCHRDAVDNRVHHNAGVHCTDCHISSGSPSSAATDVRVMGPGNAPNHSFRHAVETCAGCHGQSIHTADFRASQIDWAQTPAMSARAQELARELEDAKRSNRSLQAMSLVSLGLGLGIGGVLGVIFVLVAGFIAQGRANR